MRLRSHTGRGDVAQVNKSCLTADMWLRAECNNTIPDRSKCHLNQLRYPREWPRVERVACVARVAVWQCGTGGSVARVAVWHGWQCGTGGSVARRVARGWHGEWHGSPLYTRHIVKY